MSTRRPESPRIAILIPAFNEAACIGQTLAELRGHLALLPFSFRAIVVDDGSSDETASIAGRHDTLLPATVITLSRNFGKETALMAGFDYLNEDDDAVIIMDADMQHPIELISVFIDHWLSGYKMVYGYKQSRSGESRLKALTSRLFYKTLNSHSDFYIPPDASDFRLIDRCAIHALRSLRERVRFTKGLYAWVGFSSIGVPYTPPPRAGGKTHFNGRALRRLGLDGLTSFSDAPLRLAAGLGISFSLAAITYGLFIAARTLIYGVDVPGWATLTVAATLIGGLQLSFLGVLGLYVRNIFEETKQRPSYVVASISSPADKHRPDTSNLKMSKSQYNPASAQPTQCSTHSDAAII